MTTRILLFLVMVTSQLSRNSLHADRVRSSQLPCWRFSQKPMTKLTGHGDSSVGIWVVLFVTLRPFAGISGLMLAIPHLANVHLYEYHIPECLAGQRSTPKGLSTQVGGILRNSVCIGVP